MLFFGTSLFPRHSTRRKRPGGAQAAAPSHHRAPVVQAVCRRPPHMRLWPILDCCDMAFRLYIMISMMPRHRHWCCHWAPELSGLGQGFLFAALRHNQRARLTSWCHLTIVAHLLCRKFAADHPISDFGQSYFGISSKSATNAF
jgi:hypothetical protein